MEVWDITNGNETNKAKLVWKMVADPFGNQKGVARLSYGVKLEGFKFVTEPLQLEKGHQYRIRVAGSGEGNFRFRINPDGNVDKI